MNEELTNGRAELTTEEVALLVGMLQQAAFGEAEAKLIAAHAQMKLEARLEQEKAVQKMTTPKTVIERESSGV